MPRKFAHKLVTDVATGIACEVYEDMATDDFFYKTNPNMKKWVRKHWTYFIKDARATLAKMLADPNKPESQKEIILEALELDKTLPAGEGRAITGQLVH